jgi:hypothetical protein
MPKARQPILPILHWSLHKGVGWQSQYKRIERWYQRVMDAKSKEDLTDFLFTFFQNCYLLREWLELTADIPKADLDALFRANSELGICRDICNVTKHFSLSNPPSQKFEVSFVQEYCPPGHPYLKDGWFGGDAKLTIVTDDKNYDMRELAHQCLGIWKVFLKQRELYE